jgi:hypothetical protein
MYHSLDLGTPNKRWTVESATSILIIHQVGIAHIRACIGEISFSWAGSWNKVAIQVAWAQKNNIHEHQVYDWTLATHLTSHYNWEHICVLP